MNFVVLGSTRKWTIVFALFKVQDKLLARANAAEAVKNKSLEIFANNKDSLDKTLETLKGTDEH